MSSVNLASLFNPKSAVEDTSRMSNFRHDEYKVNFKEGVGGIYESVIRFVPWYANPEKSVIMKTLDYVKNPITQQGMYIDDPRTIGQFSPVIDMFFKFYNSGNAVFQKLGKSCLSSKPQYYALVQIIQDRQHPELVGQIKVFAFGKKLYDKLVSEEHPGMGQGNNPFHPIYGRYFYLKCASQSGFNNFDQSYFFDNKNAQGQILPMGIWYKDPNSGNLEITNENTNQQLVADYLAANSPDLGRYDYTPWTAEQEKHVNDTLKIMADYLQSGTISANLAAVNTSESATTMQVNNAPVFPGATAQPQPAAPAASFSPMGGSMSGQQSFGQNFGRSAPGAPSMGSFSMGQSSLGGSVNSGQIGQPSITGVDIPTVEPSVAPSSPVDGVGGVTTLGGSIGNIDDVIANL